jgi:hypothetical protein
MCWNGGKLAHRFVAIYYVQGELYRCDVMWRAVETYHEHPQGTSRYS